MSVCVVMWFGLFHITSSETCNVTGSLWFTVCVYVYVCGVNVGEGHFSIPVMLLTVWLLLNAKVLRKNSFQPKTYTVPTHFVIAVLIIFF